MKTKFFKFKQLLKLHLLKSRVYEYPVKKTNFNDLINTNLDQILVGLKKALQVIFQYNQTNKRILFIGFPSKLELKVNSLTRHIAVPNNFNVQGLISNHTQISSKLKPLTQKVSKTDSKLLFRKLTKKPDLIVLFDHKKVNLILSEAKVAKIPVITFVVTSDSKDLLLQNSYFVTGNFQNSLMSFDKNIFFIGLNFLFKSFKSTSKSDLPKFDTQSFIKKRNLVARKSKHT